MTQIPYPSPLGKCTFCFDEAISSREPVDVITLPDAVALVPFVSVLGSQPVVVPLGACLKHRTAQLGTNGAGRRLVMP